MRKDPPVVGIDLGTTYSCVARVDETGKAVVIKNFEGDNTTPSVVLFEDGNVVVGKTAKESSKLDPDNVVSFIKRRMGRDYTFQHAGKSYRPEEISAYILKKLASDSAQALGYEAITDVVITVPAYFGISEREATREAGRIAGLNVLEIINEPTAAAISYGMSDLTGEKIILVYDLGGGTFDVTLMKVSPVSFDVIVTDGHNELGGKNWDDRIVRHLVTKFAEATDSAEDDLYNDPQTMADLQYGAEFNIKRRLTAREKAEVVVQRDGNRERIEVTRQGFDDLTSDLLAQTIDITRKALTEAKKKGFDRFDEIILVGGSSRMPQVLQRVEQEFGMAPRLFDPDEAVARGAAIVAENRSLMKRIHEALGQVPTTEEEVRKMDARQRSVLESEARERGLDVKALLGSMAMTDTAVCAKSFGIVSMDEDGREQVTNLILRNTTLPREMEKQFGTFSEGQTEVQIQIMENELTEETVEVGMCKQIGSGSLIFGRAMPKGTPIDVTFTLKRDGTLGITARERVTGNHVNVTVETANVIRGAELDEAIRRTAGVTVLS